MADRDSALAAGDDGVTRCFWGDSPAIYRAYHDQEWGFPVDDEHRLFEKLCLEGFQAGLSWLTILRKRESFRKAFADFDYERGRRGRRGLTILRNPESFRTAFADFDYERVARFGARDVKRLLEDAAIVRHRGKI